MLLCIWNRGGVHKIGGEAAKECERERKTKSHKINAMINLCRFFIQATLSCFVTPHPFISMPCCQEEKIRLISSIVIGVQPCYHPISS